jgi:hypothetical protein
MYLGQTYARLPQRALDNLSHDRGIVYDKSAYFIHERPLLLPYHFAADSYIGKSS